MTRSIQLLNFLSILGALVVVCLNPSVCVAQEGLPLQDSSIEIPDLEADLPPLEADPSLVTLSQEELSKLDNVLIEEPWSPDISAATGLTLWDCIVIALENNRPLQIVRDDLRISGITLNERRNEFDNIYYLGAGAHYDEQRGVPAPIAPSDAGVDRDRYSFNFGGLDGSGTFLSRQFRNGGSLQLGAQSIYNSQTATRIRPFVDDNGDLMTEQFLRDVRWFSEANVVVTQPLLEGAGKVATTGLRIQELEEAAQDLNLEREIQSLVSQVVRDYLEVQLQISLVEVGIQSYRRALDQFNRTKEKIEGDHPEFPRLLSLVRAKQQIASNFSRLVDVKNNYQTSLINLRLTLGVEPSVSIVLAGTDVPEIAPRQFDLPEATGYSLQMRPDYKISRIQVQQAQINQEFAQNALLPNLDLSARMGFRHQDADFLESWELFSYEDAGADLTLSLPLNLPSDRANYERSQVRLRQSLKSREQLERVIANQVNNSYRALVTLE
ncbi:MAG: TolC family protein, partial [Candidatus Omnitrophica bacterium]|nr:TolC family protein [Candidatus Omnitrophota bacterium]